MKLLKLRIIICILILSSCSKDVLFKSDPTKITVDNFFKNESEMTQAVNGVYSQLQSISKGAWEFGELPSDNTTIDLDPGNRFYQDRLEALEFWNVISSNPDINSLFNSYYTLLYNLNFTLTKIDASSLTDTLKNRMKGELLFIRAYSYFNLVQYFGDVPLLVLPESDYKKSFAYARDPQTKVWEQVETDLKAAVSFLPQIYNSSNIGRVTKGAALALLGKTYLTLKRYPESITVLKQILNSGYSLMSSYADVFDPKKKNNSESIFEIQFQGDNTLGEGSSFMYTFAPRLSRGFVTGFATGTNSGWNMPTNDIISSYEPGDLRKSVSLKEGYTNGSGIFVPIPFINKYNHPHTIVGVTNDNWPVLRYADVLLMLAEAINEGGSPTPDAYSYINQVRSRAGLAALSALNQTSFRDTVLHERRVELAFENQRWFDLKRTKTPSDLAALLNAHGAKEKANPTISRSGIPFNAYDYLFQPYEALFPMPSSVILLDDKITQNPGY